MFNNARKYDFPTNLTIQNVKLEVVEEIRLLGVQVRADLSWCSNTSVMCKRAYARMWMLRRLKPLGATNEELLDVYEKQIRCIVEFASPVWTSRLTLAEGNQIEGVQKCAFAIILADNYKSYNWALKRFGKKSLTLRRSDLNLNFAKKCLKNEKYENWFKKNNPTDIRCKTRSDNTELLPVQARNGRFLKSPIAYLTNLINENKKK